MKIAIGADHAGFKLKEELKMHLISQNIEVRDFGTNAETSCDYPDYAFPVAEAVAAGEFDRGILICGSGVGVCIAANRVKGIRAVNAYNEEIAKQSRDHGDCNILAFGGKYILPDLAKKIADIWLKTPFSGEERHLRRINKMDR
jgi:ribose 5-phosphate isomerase B